MANRSNLALQSDPTLRLVHAPDESNHPRFHVTAAAAPGPLSPEHLQVLAEARVRVRKVRRAAGVAAMSGWTMALFAGITLLGVLFGSMVSFILGMGLSIIAYNELRGAAMLRRLEPRAARRLGYNQICLGALIVLYSAWSLVSAMRSDPLAAMGGSSGDAGVDELVGDLSSMVAYGLYGGMAVVGFVVPGLTAWYYFTRGNLVRKAVAQTPAWAIETLRAAS
jgi:hypothetical protein